MIIRSKRVLVKEEIRPVDILIADGVIVEIAPYNSFPNALDFGDKIVLPGMIDLHSDAIEKEIEPRPGVIFPIKQALFDLERKLSVFGITTIFHAISFETEIPGKIRSADQAEQIVKAIREYKSQEIINNLVHLRYDIASNSFEIVKDLIREGWVDLISIMEHAPAKGQFHTLEKWQKYYAKEYNLTCNELELLKNKKEATNYEKVIELITIAKECGIPVASHDDDSIEKIDFMSSKGVLLTEFPLSLEVARWAKKKSMYVGMGAPNVVRNKSQCGNVSARVLIKNRVCDYLCSDYHPSSMLKAVYMLYKKLGLPLFNAVELVTKKPAKAVKLTNIGVIDKNKSADIIVVNDKNEYPDILMTLCRGKIIYERKF